MTERARNTMCLALTLALAWASGAAAQGLYWESTTTGIGTEPRTAQVYAVPKMLKVVQKDGRTVIVRSDENKVIAMNTAKRTYREIEIPRIEGATRDADAPDAMRKQMEERVKQLPPEQRAMMEKMLPSLGAPGGKASPIKVTRTDETKTINGYACTKYVATQGDKIVLVAWTTRDIKGFDALRSDWLSFQKRMSAVSPVDRGVAEAYTDIDGFPIETEMGPVKTEVTKVEVRSTPASEFAVPVGYALEAR